MDNILEAGLSIISTSATGVIGYLMYRLRKHEEYKEAQRIHQQEQEVQRIHQQKQEAAALRESLLALTRDRILQGYRYYKREGGLSTQDLETMTKLYDAYHALGGNGTISAVYNKITGLPIQEE